MKNSKGVDSIDLVSLVNRAYMYHTKYSKKFPYSPVSLVALDNDLEKSEDVFNKARDYRHMKVIEMLGHMVEEIHEVRQCVPRRPWRVSEPSFLDSMKLRKEFTKEFVDVLLFFTAALVWAGISGEEFMEAYWDKENENETRADHDKEKM